MSLISFPNNNPVFVDPKANFFINPDRFYQDINNRGSIHSPSPEYNLFCGIIAAIVSNADLDLTVPQRIGDSPTVKPMPGAITRENIVGKICNSTSRILLSSSGTTGPGKRVSHSLDSLCRGLQINLRHQNDIWGLAYPLNHLAGLQVMLQAVINHNTIVQLFGLPAELIHRSIESNQITHLSCTPTFLKLLSTTNTTHPTVQSLTTGGERLGRLDQELGKKLFPGARHRNIYALTEIGNLLISENDIFTISESLNGKVKIIDGGLSIHTSLLASKTNESGDDWYRTGDLVEVIEHNPLKFRFLTRRDEIINVGGNKVVPQIVEQSLLEITGIEQALVYGKGNSLTGQIVACDIVTSSNQKLNFDEVRLQLTEQLPKFAVPRIYNLVPTLKMTTNGKLCRRPQQS